MADRLAKANIRAAGWGSTSLPEGFTIGKDEQFLRFVTSFVTTEQDIAAVLRAVAG